MIAPLLIRLSLAIVSMRNLRLASPNGLQANSCWRETAETARAWWRDAEQCQSRRVVSAHQTNTLDPPRLDNTSHVILVTSYDPLVVGQNVGFPCHVVGSVSSDWHTTGDAHMACDRDSLACTMPPCPFWAQLRSYATAQHAR